MSALLGLARICGKTGGQPRGSIPIVEIHSRIAQKVGLHHQNLAAIVSRQGHREECHPALVPGRHRNNLVSILEGIEELGLKIALILLYIRHKCLIVTGHHELSLLRHHVRVSLESIAETVGQTLIVSPENEGELLEDEFHLIVVVMHLGPLVHNRMKDLVHRTPDDLAHLVIETEDNVTGEVHRDGRRSYNLVSGLAYGISNPLPDRYIGLEASVRRCNLIVHIGCGDNCPCCCQSY